jgi:hypothetical protein
MAISTPGPSFGGSAVQLQSASFKTVTSTSQQFSVTLNGGLRYLFTSNVWCCIAQGTNPTAALADGSMFVPSNTPIVIQGRDGHKLAVIRTANENGFVADGIATIVALAD